MEVLGAHVPKPRNLTVLDHDRIEAVPGGEALGLATPFPEIVKLWSRLQNSRGIGVGAVLSSLGEHDLPWIVDWISCRENRRHAGR